MKRKTLLYKSAVEYADFCINHVEGCSHGCKFPCYAFQMSRRFGKAKTYSEWIKPKVVTNALELLDKEIPKYKDQIKFVHLCFMTDPFMYKQKKVEEMTLRIIEKLNKNDIRCTSLTKGIYPKVLADKTKFSSENEYGITLVSLDEDFKKKFEPFSSPYEKRIKSLKFLHDNGLKTWVSIEPYPTPNLAKHSLPRLLKKISFVDKIIFGKLNYNVISSKYKDNEEFYEECADQVISFCKKNRINYHIKVGTKKSFDKQTLVIFNKETNKQLIIE